MKFNRINLCVRDGRKRRQGKGHSKRSEGGRGRREREERKWEKITERGEKGRFSLRNLTSATGEELVPFHIYSLEGCSNRL